MLCSQLFTHVLLALSLTIATSQESWGMIIGGNAAQSFLSETPSDLPQQQKKNNYTLFNTKKNWDDAREDCIGRGMEFAAIMNDAENEEVVKLITDSGNGHDDVNYWTCGKYIGHDDVFAWYLKSTLVTYNKWHRSVRVSKLDEELQSPENYPRCTTCIEINRKFNNEWTDSCCDIPQYYICKSRDTEFTAIV